MPRLLLLAVLSLVAIALGACGGDDISSKSAPDVLKETFGPGKPVNSGKLDLRISFDSQGLEGVQGPLKLALKGPFASSGKQKLPRFDFDANLDVSGQQLAAGAVSTGDKAWLKFAGDTYAVDDATFKQFRTLYERDQKKASESDDATFEALGVDPVRWLAGAKKAEEETVGGAETVHVTSKVDVPKFLEDVNKLLGRADATGAAAAAGAGDVPSQLTPEQRKQIQESSRTRASTSTRARTTARCGGLNIRSPSTSPRPRGRTRAACARVASASTSSSPSSTRSRRSPLRRAPGRSPS
jgi:hypothetical protein